jgi:tetratricopeptide (TPR) repeat protein
MLGGDPPFVGTTPQAILARKLTDRAPSLKPLRDTVTDKLEQVVLQSLARSPADRFTTAELFADALAAAQRGNTAPTVRVRLGDKPRRMLPIVGAVFALAMIAAVAVTLMLRPEGGVTLNADHVVVAVFRNATGDTSLDLIGERIGHWITYGLQQAAIPVTPWDLALQSSDYVRIEAEAGRVRDRARALAEETGAGIVVSGAVYLAEGDSLEVQLNVTDAILSRLLGSIDPFRVSRASENEAIATAQQRVTVFLASRFEEEMQDFVPLETIATAPTFEAYQDFKEGFRLHHGANIEEAIPHYRRAFESDSTWAAPLLRLTQVLVTLSRNDSSRIAEYDSVMVVLERLWGRMSPYERAEMEYNRAVRNGDSEGVRRALRRAMELAPRSPAFFNYIGVTIIDHRPREVIDLLQTVDPERGWLRGRGFPFYWNRLVQAYLMLGEHDQVLDAIERAYRLHPDKSDYLLFTEAWALAALGRVRSLERVMDEVDSISAEPGPARRTYVRVVESLHAHGHLERSAHVLERVMQWFESRPNEERESRGHRDWYGRALIVAGRNEEANAVFQTLVEEDPEDMVRRGFLGFVAATRGDSVVASQCLTWLDGRAIRRSTTEWMYWSAAIVAALGDRERAVEFLRGDDFHQFIDRSSIELSPLRGYEPFEEWLRPKG